MIAKKCKGGRHSPLKRLSQPLIAFHLPKRKYNPSFISQNLIKQHQKTLLYTPKFTLMRSHRGFVPKYFSKNAHEDHRHHSNQNSNKKRWTIFALVATAVIGTSVYMYPLPENPNVPLPPANSPIDETPDPISPPQEPPIVQAPKSLFEMRCSIAPYEAAVLSQHICSNSNNKIKAGDAVLSEDGKIKGWEVKEVFGNDRYQSFKAVLYFNSTKEQMVLAYAYQGSSPESSKLPDTLTAQKYLSDILKKTLDYANEEKATLCLTGYSLGGSLAQITAFTAKNKHPDKHVKTITFDSPETEKDFNGTPKMDITNYLSYPNAVNTLGIHGNTTTYRVKFEDHCKGDSMGDFIKAFDPDTGDFKENVSQMFSWPKKVKKIDTKPTRFFNVDPMFFTRGGTITGGLFGYFLSDWRLEDFPSPTRVIVSTILGMVGLGIPGFLVDKHRKQEKYDNTPLPCSSEEKFIKDYDEDYHGVDFQKHIIHDRHMSKKVSTLLEKLQKLDDKQYEQEFYSNYLGCEKFHWDKEEHLLTVDEGKDIRLVLDCLQTNVQHLLEKVEKRMPSAKP